MPKHIYAWNALIDLPPHGKYSGARGGLQGETHAATPQTESELRQSIARDVAAQQGCDANGITFASFTYTELTTA
ncbi:hypothetical protein EST92_11655 [Streptomyces sp. TM32]|uniref:hypothetical protein n=1 Tax=Streptomyces sp. TM32 TaxID=1652669 RepID=UPI001010C3AC|nr:hypothetical protein [Streptomyces sp. TM32]RXS84206.1 hypothetical protein EST92_11655 [Streptomyces sp. TM32]